LDLIHANEARNDIGFVKFIERLDAEISQSQEAGLDENSFEVVVDDDTWANDPILEGHFLYVPGTEIGGPVEELKHSTASGLVTLSGPTWRGMLMRKVIVPPSGSAYLTISNMEANAAISAIIGAQFGDIIGVSAEDTNVTVSGQFRFDIMLFGIEKMLAASGLALAIEYNQTARKAILCARPVVDYSDVIDLSQDYGVNMTSHQGRIDGYNHIIGLGAGELLDRDIVHRYRLADGTITSTPPAWAGTEADKVLLYDYSNAESVEKLAASAEEKLMEYAPQKSIEMDPAGIDLLLGDIVGARDRLTGLQAEATVIVKIYKLDSNGLEIQTKVG
jgi:hypothetical protein